MAARPQHGERLAESGAADFGRQRAHTVQEVRRLGAGRADPCQRVARPLKLDARRRTGGGAAQGAPPSGCSRQMPRPVVSLPPICSQGLSVIQVRRLSSWVAVAARDMAMP